MGSIEVATSTDLLIRIFVFLLYASVFLIVNRRLIPRLSPTAKRMAMGMLVAQVLVIAVSLELRPDAKFGNWLWDFHEEWNIPATLASVQLAMVAGVALLLAWLVKAQPAWKRLYLVGIGLVFVFLGIDEFLALHESIAHWGNRYILLGAVVVAATLIVILLSSRREAIWQLVLLVGLAMSAAGAMVFNAIPTTCDSLGFLRFDGCLQFFFQEESLEFLGIWLVLLAVLGQFSEILPTPSPRARRVLYSLPALWLVVLVLNSLSPVLELRLLARPAAVEFQKGVSLHGYSAESDANSYASRIYISAKQGEYMGLGYSIHLVDQVTGESVAGHNEWADRQHGNWLFGPDHRPLYRQWMEVEIPTEAPVNRALWVVLTLWRKKGGEFIRQKVIGSDQHLLDDTQVVLGELVLPAVSDSPLSKPIALFGNGFSLSALDIPEHAKAGEILSISFSWHSDVDSVEDHTQFLHLGHDASGEWWVYDQQPLGARLPTRLWYSGLADSETWQVPLPADLAPGRYNVFTGLYRASDKARVPASDAEGMPFVDARVPMGLVIIE